MGFETGSRVQRFKSLEMSPSKGSTPDNIRRGKGLACMIKATITPSISCAVVKLNEDASLSIYTGTVEMGQGSETVLAQIAGKELGIPLPTIQVLGVDTDVVPYDLTTSSSRSTFHMGKAVQLAAQDIMRQLQADRRQRIRRAGRQDHFRRRQDSLAGNPARLRRGDVQTFRHAGRHFGR